MINPKEKAFIHSLERKIYNDADILGLIHYGSSLTSKYYRDIDLCIVSKSPNISIEKKISYRLFLPEKFDVHFFCDLPLYIKHEVLKKGKKELIKDEEKLYDIAYVFIKEYSLFEPHFKKYLENLKIA